MLRGNILELEFPPQSVGYNTKIYQGTVTIVDVPRVHTKT